MTLLQILDLPGLRARESAEPGFVEGLQALADRLNLEPSYIAAVMSLESGVNPQAVNKTGGATGLIQFMPQTATGLGTSTSALRGMSAIQQLAFVEKYYAAAGRAIRRDTPGDYYMATFMPAFVGAPATTELGRQGDKIYDQNAGLDRDHDGVLTVSDVWSAIDGAVASARTRPMFVVDTLAEKKSPLQTAPVLLPSLPSSSPASASSSFGALSGSVPGVAAKPMTTHEREIVVFAASCELENFALMVQNKDEHAQAQRICDYWVSVLPKLSHPPFPPAWCGAFALWCLHQAELGQELEWKFGPPHFGFLWNLRKLERSEVPEPGDIAYLDKPYQHHAIVVAVEGSIVHTIDGNQGSLAPIKTHDASLTHWTAFYSIASLLPAPTPEAA